MGTLNSQSAHLVEASLRITRAMLVAYGSLTRDSNPIHLDEAFAASTPYGRCIAHGTLSLNALWQSIDATFTAEMTARAAVDIRFTAPVFVGEILVGGGERVGDGRYEVWVKTSDRLVISGNLSFG
ncbi:MAG: MaoC family dehydratase [Betaproteobacteria bacterium]